MDAKILQYERGSITVGRSVFWEMQNQFPAGEVALIKYRVLFFYKEFDFNE